MLGLLFYILVSLMIYYVVIDWPWIVFSAAVSATMLGIGIGALLCRPVPVQRLLWQQSRML